VTDEGIFGPDSVAWRLHADPVMLVGGLRALLVQALEPRAMAAVDQHSRFREDPWGRLERTTSFVMSTTYGDTAAAEAAAARVRAVHMRIHGVDPVTSLPYSGSDPDLLLWIHAVEVESFILAYRTYAGGLSRAEADRYVVEMGRVAEMVELPAAMVPQSEGEVREYLRSVRGLCITPAARDGLRVILFPPMHLAYRPLWAIPTTAAIAILPSYARRMYRLPWVPGAALPVRAAVFALSRALNAVTPPPPVVREAQARVHGLAA
jgi:uncharacterized protein (DUF2236 family)